MDSVIELQDLKTMLQLNTTDQDGLLDYIVLEVCVRRYNRLKNEGMTSYSQEGESITFKSDDFDDFQDDISAWKEANNVPDASLGSARFINPFR